MSLTKVKNTADQVQNLERHHKLHFLYQTQQYDQFVLIVLCLRNMKKANRCVTIWIIKMKMQQEYSFFDTC